MHYVFIEEAPLLEGQTVELLPEDVNHVYRVLRLREGARITVGDGREKVFSGVITYCKPGSVRVLLEKAAGAAESPLRITLLQSLAKGEKMDLIVRQATELGVSRIIPVITRRSVPKWDEYKEQRHLTRWQNIARSAASQCRRGRIPAVDSVANFAEALNKLPPPGEGLTIVPWEGERQLDAGELFQQTFPGGRPLFLFVGPEGGFAESEIKILSSSGAVTIHLGPRILRTETAAAVMLALAQAAWGDLGGGYQI